MNGVPTDSSEALGWEGMDRWDKAVRWLDPHWYWSLSWWVRVGIVGELDRH